MNPEQDQSRTTAVARPFTPQKTWLAAKRKTGNPEQTRINAAVEMHYTSILTKAISLLSPSTQPIFHRDYRYDTAESTVGMHCWLCSSFYWYLECDPLHNYRVEYAFHNCPFQDEIKGMILGFTFDTGFFEVQLKPDFTTCYRTVLRYQDDEYITNP